MGFKISVLEIKIKKPYFIKLQEGQFMIMRPQHRFWRTEKYSLTSTGNKIFKAYVHELGSWKSKEEIIQIRVYNLCITLLLTHTHTHVLSYRGYF